MRFSIWKEIYVFNRLNLIDKCFKATLNSHLCFRSRAMPIYWSWNNSLWVSENMIPTERNRKVIEEMNIVYPFSDSIIGSITKDVRKVIEEMNIVYPFSDSIIGSITKDVRKVIEEMNIVYPFSHPILFIPSVIL